MDIGANCHGRLLEQGGHKECELLLFDPRGHERKIDGRVMFGLGRLFQCQFATVPIGFWAASLLLVRFEPALPYPHLHFHRHFQYHGRFHQLGHLGLHHPFFFFVQIKNQFVMHLKDHFGF